MRLLNLSKGSTVTALAFSPDSRLLVAGADRVDVRVWDLNSSKKPMAFPRTRSTNGLAITPEGIVCIAHNSGVDVWFSFGQVEHFTLASEIGIWRLTLSTDGMVLFCLNTSQRKFSCYQLPDLTQTWSAQWAHDPSCYYYYPCWDSIGNRPMVAAASVVHFLDPNNGSVVKSFRLTDDKLDSIRTATMSTDGCTFACLLQGLQIFDPTSGKFVKRLTEITPHQSCLAFSPVAPILASGLYNGDVRFWRTTDWTELPTFSPDLGEIHSLAFSPDGCTLAAGGTKGRIAIWDLD